MSSLRIRVGAICCENNSLLLVEHEKDNKRYWLLPGGGMQVGETMKDALVREVMEETSIEIRVNDLLGVCESISPDKTRHIVHLLYEVVRIGGEPGVSRDPRVRRSVFLPIAELDNIMLHPPICGWLKKLLTTDSPRALEYLGALWI